ncbi:MAG: SUMF1/EgtB/PvdO family nonheme iron enzyme [Cyanobacteria bacterium P01_G01_bin.54]
MTSNTHHHPCIVIVTVTKVETQAAIAAFEQLTGQPAKDRSLNDEIYYFELGTVNQKQILLTQSEMGDWGFGGSQQTVNEAIDAFSPEAVIMVGIAFGINEQKQQIGDILVSRQLRPYDLERVGEKETWVREGKYDASPRLLKRLRSADVRWQGAAVKFGVILTGEKLIDNVVFRNQLISQEPEAIGGEMEGKGLSVACQNKKVDWILVKAICDWADGNKAEDKATRQELAARNAAEFVAYALQFGSPQRVSVQAKAKVSDSEPVPDDPFKSYTSQNVMHNAASRVVVPRLTYPFEYVKLNAAGKIVERKQGEAEYFNEDLGSGVTLEMTAIPSGTFRMGGKYGAEKPIHNVRLESFWMGKFAVTQEQWARVASFPKVQIELNPDPAYFKGANRPVHCVNWYEAIEFCARLSRQTGENYRLPSEAEWEYACRAGTTTHYHCGDVLSAAVANYDASNTWNGSPKGKYRQQTTPVGSFPANPWGLYDLHGNVSEWCADPWHHSYANAPLDGRVWNNENENHSPSIWRSIENFLTPQLRVHRGGCWISGPRFCRSGYRHWWNAGSFTSQGFRMCRSRPDS